MVRREVLRFVPARRREVVRDRDLRGGMSDIFGGWMVRRCWGGGL